MNFHFITLFPNIIDAYLTEGVLGRAVKSKIISYDVFNPRDYTRLKHGQVDDRPYGGGSGMVLRADVLADTLKIAFEKNGLDVNAYERLKCRVLVTAASGKVLTQQGSEVFLGIEHLFVVCGRYEGIDQRFIDKYADETISIGEFVLSGGELAALTIADVIARQIKGVLGNEESLINESYSKVYKKEHPHYTRPDTFEGLDVPMILKSGDHDKIKDWRNIT